ncbi:MAG: SDR family oxidoreductase, partial [SAR324 cluster bacterium]|nr:SDR family oxidoreductase [SAR324 cluster bacterium]
AASRHPLKRIGSAEETANSVLYLLSKDSSWMTGQILKLDGGISSVKPL